MKTLIGIGFAFIGLVSYVFGLVVTAPFYVLRMFRKLSFSR